MHGQEYHPLAQKLYFLETMFTQRASSSESPQPFEHQKYIQQAIFPFPISPRPKSSSEASQQHGWPSLAYGLTNGEGECLSSLHNHVILPPSGRYSCFQVACFFWYWSRKIEDLDFLLNGAQGRLSISSVYCSPLYQQGVMCPLETLIPIRLLSGRLTFSSESLSEKLLTF